MAKTKTEEKKESSKLQGKRFSESYGREMTFKGEDIKIDDALGNEFTLQDAIIRPSKYHSGEIAIIGMTDTDGENRVMITSSGVIIGQVKRIIDDKAFPLIVVFKKDKSKTGQEYYTLS